MKAIEKELAALASLAPAQLRERWHDLNAGPAPNVPVPLLRRLIAQKLQEKRHGSLPAMVARELERPSASGPVSAGHRPPSPSLTPGTRLIREWNGTTIAVEVLDDGFAWNGETYRSLSQIAKAVTGAHWSGPRFFGLYRRG